MLRGGGHSHSPAPIRTHGAVITAAAPYEVLAGALCLDDLLTAALRGGRPPQPRRTEGQTEARGDRAASLRRVVELGLKSRPKCVLSAPGTVSSTSTGLRRPPGSPHCPLEVRGLSTPRESLGQRFMSRALPPR